MKSFEGKIVSLSMNNTAVVEIFRKTPHPLYKKLIKRSKKYKADTNGLDLTLGAVVKIVETKPYSKDKYFKVVGPTSSKKIEKKVSEKPVEAKAETKKVEKVITKKATVRKTRKAAK